MNSFEDNRTYTDFAGVYDNFMDDIPYEAWSSFVRNLLEVYDVYPDGNTVIGELGCGTGTMTKLFLEAGYNIEASDLSEAMLAVAKKKCSFYSEDTSKEGTSKEGTSKEGTFKESTSKENEEHCRGRVTFCKADMRDFKLTKQVPAIISLCDSVNYLVQEQDLERLFTAVRKNLCAGGVFIFDLKTLWLYENAMADNVFADTRHNCAYIWENYFDTDTGINEYALTLFLENEQGSYDRCEEIHLQKAYEPEDIIRAADRAQMEVAAIYGQEPFEELLEEDERMFVVLRKPERK